MLAEAHAAGDAVTLACGPRTCSSRAGPCRGSRRATPTGRVASIRRPGANTLLRCALDAGGELLARVAAAVAELGLAPSAPVVLAVKSHSIRLIGPGARGAR
ncbi:MAG: TOBE domain-containing protein [Vicinamibacteria bacterium]